MQSLGIFKNVRIDMTSKYFKEPKRFYGVRPLQKPSIYVTSRHDLSRSLRKMSSWPKEVKNLRDFQTTSISPKRRQDIFKKSEDKFDVKAPERSKKST